MTMDVIVIGAGFAGLTAATRLQDAGCAVTVLEARDRVGGRTKAGELAGRTIDLGGMWLGPSQTRLAGLAEKFSVATYVTPLEGMNVMRIAGETSQSSRDGIENAFSEPELAEYGELLMRLATMSEDLDPSRPWAGTEAQSLDQVTVAAWLEANVAAAKMRAVFTSLVAGIFCAEPREISMLWFLTYCKTGGGLFNLLSADVGGAQNLLFDGGVHSLAVKLAESLNDVRLNEPVTQVRRELGGVTVSTARDTYEASKLIMAVSPALVPRIKFNPPLPRKHAALHARMPMGSVIKAWIAFERPYWRDHGLNGLIFGDDADFSPAFDVTPPGETGGFISGFFDGDRAIDWSDRTAAEREECVLTTVSEFLGKPTCAQIGYAETDWCIEAWSQGCYGGFAPPGALTKLGESLREPVGAIHWAGSETATEWIGYIEGAIQSGERAAEEVLASR